MITRISVYISLSLPHISKYQYILNLTAPVIKLLSLMNHAVNTNAQTYESYYWLGFKLISAHPLLIMTNTNT